MTTRRPPDDVTSRTRAVQACAVIQLWKTVAPRLWCIVCAMPMHPKLLLTAATLLPLLAACAKTNQAGAPAASPIPAPTAEAQIAAQPCGYTDKLVTHQIHQGTTTHALSPCSANGSVDFSGAV